MEEEGIECCDCDCVAFAPQRLCPRLCSGCSHGWFQHAKAYILTPQDLSPPPDDDSNLELEPDHGLVWRLGSLVLWGTQAIPVRLKILLDRLLAPPLPPTDRQGLLEDFGWTDEDLGRNYILQDHMGRSLSRWEMASPVEELAMLRFFAAHLGAVAHEGIRVVGRLAAEMIGSEAEAEMPAPPPNLAPARLRDFIVAQNNQMDPFIRHYEVCRARSEDGGGSRGEEEEEEEASEGSNAPPSSSAGIFPSHPFLGHFGAFLSPPPHRADEGDTESVSVKAETPTLGQSPPIGSTGKRKVTCDICLHNYCDKGALKIHKGAKHFGEMHACTIPGCPYLFSSRRSRNRHSANPNPKLHKRDPKKDYSLPPHCRVVSPPAAAAAWEREQRERGLAAPSPTLSRLEDAPAKRRRKNQPIKLNFNADGTQPPNHSPFHQPLAIDEDGKEEEELPLDFSQGHKRQTKSPSPPPPPTQNLFRPAMDVSVLRAQAMQENMLAAMMAARASMQQHSFPPPEEPQHHAPESTQGDDMSETLSGLDADENPMPLSTPAPSPPGGNGGVIMSPTKTALGTIVEVPIYQNNPRRCTGCQKDFQNHFSVKTHYLNVHLKILIPCTIPGCNSAFPSKRSRDRHSQNYNLHQKLLTGGTSPVQPGFTRSSSPFHPPTVRPPSTHLHSPTGFQMIEKRRQEDCGSPEQQERKPVPSGPKPGEGPPGRPMLPFPYQHWLQSLAAANPQLFAAYGSQLGALGALSRLGGGGPGPLPASLLGPNPFQVQ